MEKEIQDRLEAIQAMVPRISKEMSEFIMPKMEKEIAETKARAEDVNFAFQGAMQVLLAAMFCSDAFAQDKVDEEKFKELMTLHLESYGEQILLSKNNLLSHMRAKKSLIKAGIKV